MVDTTEASFSRGLELTRQILENPESDQVPGLLDQLDAVLKDLSVNFQAFASLINIRDNRGENPLISDDEIMAYLAINERVINDVLGINNS